MKSKNISTSFINIIRTMNIILQKNNRSDIEIRITKYTKMIQVEDKLEPYGANGNHWGTSNVKKYQNYLNSSRNTRKVLKLLEKYKDNQV